MFGKVGPACVPRCLKLLWLWHESKIGVSGNIFPRRWCRLALCSEVLPRPVFSGSRRKRGRRALPRGYWRLRGGLIRKAGEINNRIVLPIVRRLRRGVWNEVRAYCWRRPRPGLTGRLWGFIRPREALPRVLLSLLYSVLNPRRLITTQRK